MGLLIGHHDPYKTSALGIVEAVPADLSSDVHRDLLWQHQTAGAVAVWFLIGTTHIGGAGIVDAMDPAWKVVGPKY